MQLLISQTWRVSQGNVQSARATSGCHLFEVTDTETTYFSFTWLFIKVLFGFLTHYNGKKNIEVDRTQMMQHTSYSYRWMRPLSHCAHVKLHVGVKRPADL